MPITVFIAHAEGEVEIAEKIAIPIKEAGYEIFHLGKILIGESITAEASKALSGDGPIVLCGTVKAMGTRWPHRIVNSAGTNSKTRVFPLQIEREAYMEPLSLGNEVGLYWKDPYNAIQDLLDSLRKYYPIELHNEDTQQKLGQYQEGLIKKYRRLGTSYVDLDGSEINTSIDQIDLIAIEVLSDNEDEYTQDGENTEEHMTAKAEKRQGRISELCSTINQLVILGEPGIGKSFCLQYLVYRNAIQKDRIPIYLELRFFTEKDYILEKAAETLSLNIQALENLIRLDKIILYIDGLNEIISETLSRNVRNDIRRILQKYPSISIVITSRPNAYNNDFTLAAFYLQHMSTLQITEYVNKNYDDKQRGTDLLQAITTTPRLERICQNPLMLKFIIGVLKDNNDTLPENKGQLMRSFFRAKILVDNILKIEKSKNVFLDKEIIVSLISYLAYTTRYRELVGFTPGAAVFILREKLHLDGLNYNSYDFINKVKDINFLEESEKGQLSFTHEMYQEYFAAEELVKIHDEHELAGNKLNDLKALGKVKNFYNWEELISKSNWHEPIILYSGLTKNREKVLKSIARVDPLLAVECLLSSLTPEPVLQNYIEEEAEKKAIYSSDSNESAKGIMALIELGKIDLATRLLISHGGDNKKYKKIIDNIITRQDDVLKFLLALSATENAQIYLSYTLRNIPTSKKVSKENQEQLIPIILNCLEPKYVEYLLLLLTKNQYVFDGDSTPFETIAVLESFLRKSARSSPFYTKLAILWATTFNHTTHESFTSFIKMNVDIINNGELALMETAKRKKTLEVIGVIMEYEVIQVDVAFIKELINSLAQNYDPVSNNTIIELLAKYFKEDIDFITSILQQLIQQCQKDALIVALDIQDRFDLQGIIQNKEIAGILYKSFNIDALFYFFTRRSIYFTKEFVEVCSGIVEAKAMEKFPKLFEILRHEKELFDIGFKSKLVEASLNSESYKIIILAKENVVPLKLTEQYPIELFINKLFSLNQPQATKVADEWIAYYGREEAFLDYSIKEGHVFRIDIKNINSMDGTFKLPGLYKKKNIFYNLEADAHEPGNFVILRKIKIKELIFEKLKRGDSIQCKIIKVHDFGVNVEIAGLHKPIYICNSDISAKNLIVGDIAPVIVKFFAEDSMRLSIPKI